MNSISDDGFNGTKHETLPPVDYDFSCKQEGSNPETVVDVSQDDEWIRIPVSGVDEWVNKDGPSDITRTAKVTFPMEWGGESIIQFVNGFRSQNGFLEQNDPFDKCRIYFWDKSPTADNAWQIAHHGYVGGVGPSDSGTAKFWVYDAADLMKGISVSQGFNQPSLSRALEFAVRGVDENGEEVGLESVDLWDEINYTVYGENSLPAQKKENIRSNLGDSAENEVDKFRQQWGWLTVTNPLASTIIDVADTLQSIINNVALDNNKRFQVNRHNMIDYMEWITSLLDARWWFEPFADAPLLVIDASSTRSGQAQNSYDRRYFVDTKAVEDWRDVQDEAREAAMTSEFEQRETDLTQEDIDSILNQDTEKFTLDDVPSDFLPPHNYNIFEQVRTLDNDALADIKPFNTLELYGEGTTIRERYSLFDELNLSQASAVGAYTEEYPYVKVQYEPLIERANGFEYGTQPVESDKVFLNTAESAAIKEFRNHLAEETEGSIRIRGEPYIMPYDYIVSLPVCNETYENVNADPIEWEVNGVHHKRHVGEPYTTDLTVSIAVEDRHINVASEYRET
jgi:hypothetical protein